MHKEYEMSPHFNIESTKQLDEIVKKSDVEDGNTQTPAMEIRIGTQSFRDTLVLMKRSKKLFKLEEKDIVDVFGNGVLNQPLRESRIVIKKQELDVPPDNQAYFIFTNTKLTTKFLDNVEKETVFDTLENGGF